MAIPNPNPNIADGISCDNKTYSSNKIESLISTSQLPDIGEGDEGKVVTVGSDGYELDTPVAPTSIIDDSASSASTVYSSDKVDTLLSNKADSSSFTVKTADYTDSTGVAAGAIDTQTITVNDATYGIITGLVVAESTDVVPIQFRFSAANTISFRVRNVGTATSTYKIYVMYI